MDFNQITDEALLLLRDALNREMAKRKNAATIVRHDIDCCFPGLPHKGATQAVLTAYYEELLNQDWSSHFPQSSGERRFYVYAHCHTTGGEFLLQSNSLPLKMPGAPFYIGKGTGARAYDLKRNQGHGALLRQLCGSGSKPEDIVHLIASNLTESEALALESKLIYLFGTKYESGRNGILLNLDIPARPNFTSWRNWVKKTKHERKLALEDKAV